jgi:hypothetical protein
MKKIYLVSILLTAFLLAAFAFPSEVSADSLDDSKVVVGESYTLESGRILEGDLNVLGGVVEIQKDASVNGNLFVLGGQVTIDGTINGNLVAVGGSVSLEGHAVINGDVVSPGSHISREPGAVIQGNETSNYIMPWDSFEGTIIRDREYFQPRTTGVVPILTRVGRFIGMTFLMVALGGLLLLLLAKPAQVMSQAVLSEPWQILGYGALTALAAFVAIPLLSITICLIPLAILVGFAVGLATLMGWLVLGYALGQKVVEDVFKSTWHPALTAVFGNFILFLIAGGLDLIPCLGGLLNLILLMFALGIGATTLFGTKPFPRTAVFNEGKQIILSEETIEPVTIVDEPDDEPSQEA